MAAFGLSLTRFVAPFEAIYPSIYYIYTNDPSLEILRNKSFSALVNRKNQQR